MEAEKLILHDIDAERRILSAFVGDSRFAQSIVINKVIVKQHFEDRFHIDVFLCVFNFFRKHGSIPPEKDLKRQISTFMTKLPAFKKGQLEVWKKGCEKLYNGFDKNIIKADTATLEDLRKARLLRKTIIQCSRSFDKSDYSGGFSLMMKSSMESSIIEKVDDVGEITEDFEKHHIAILEQQRQGLLQPLATGMMGTGAFIANRDKKTGVVIPQASDYVEIDIGKQYLDNGWFPGDFGIVVGAQNVGKSFTLMDMCYNVARISKENVALFTIEMGKIKQERRIYSRLTGIPYKKFRMGTLDSEDLKLIRKRIGMWKEKCGRFIIVAFGRGCTAADIEHKMTEIENSWGEKIGFIAIDYLNDMKPMGKFASDRDWQAIGSISWDLAQLAKYWDNHKGIPIMTANQRKDSKKRAGTLDDTAYGKIIMDHATLGFAVSQDSDDNDKTETKRLRWALTKNRDAPKGQQWFTFPEFSQGKLHSQKLAKRYFNVVDDPAMNF